MAKIVGAIICLLMVAMDVMAGILGIEAEIEQNKVKHLRLWIFECRDPSEQAFKLGLGAAALLGLAHVIANLLGGCNCICSQEELEKASPSRQLSVACLIFTWIIFAVGLSMLAFNLVDQMEDESYSDEGEVNALQEGLAAVKFSKDFKRQIQRPWECALIVKVFGHSVGFTFLHNRLLSLWKPAGRLECVDLGHDFFLTRFSLREDYDTILKKGPWFIVVWIRLNELPIEYYNEEALVQIGKIVGTVLRIDTHIASKTRGRFVRLCVQIDVAKPLVTGIMIGKFEQLVSYEGIHRLCLDCGRVGHHKENCPFTIRRPLSTVMGTEREVASSSCSLHVSDVVKDKEGPTGSVLHAEHEEVSEGPYGPWIVVARKETRNFRSSGMSLP
ncbi:hypothetical protein CMV_030441 [Castanea mollissima]|uniref:CCHC-type domain-containing protein n=1 Tax=Castanea mollissima TaxID=60419 RepID=A0A8J4V344_9ROSI|nr:hypothetical protein CMV_030441 [Castanea mollissima]